MTRTLLMLGLGWACLLLGSAGSHMPSGLLAGIALALVGLALVLRALYGPSGVTR